MKTLDEFLDDLKHLELIHRDTDDCGVSYHTELSLKKADRIIREFMYFVGSHFGKNTDLENEIDKILNGEEGE
jgi:hypothetical protein